MHIHRPKAVTGLGEFLAEIGVIVVGIAIALGGEQVVEHFRTEARLHAVEDQMRWEVSRDDGPQAAVRVALSPCAASSLARMRAQAEAGASRAELWSSIAAYQIPHYTWDSLSYQAALASGVAAHMNLEAFHRWELIFSVIPALNGADENERRDGAELRALGRTGGAITPDERARLLGAVEKLATDNAELTGFAQFTLNGMKQADIKPAPERAPWAMGELQDRPMAAACLPALKRMLQ